MNTTTAFIPTDAETPAAEKDTVKTGRPAKHADAAARQKAWRAANKVKAVRLDGKLAPTIAKLAQQYDISETHVINNLCRFALANCNFSQMGVGGWAISDKRCKTGKQPAPAVRDDSLDSFSLV